MNSDVVKSIAAALVAKGELLSGPAKKSTIILPLTFDEFLDFYLTEIMPNDAKITPELRKALRIVVSEYYPGLEYVYPSLVAQQMNDLSSVDLEGLDKIN